MPLLMFMDPSWPKTRQTTETRRADPHGARNACPLSQSQFSKFLFDIMLSVLCAVLQCLHNMHGV